MSSTNRLLVILNSMLALILIMVIAGVNASTVRAQGSNTSSQVSSVVASTTSIHACVTKKTGAIRIAPKCKKTETALSWSVQGPKGTTGAAGANGLPGVQGEIGLTGPAGTSPTVGSRTILVPTNLCGSRYVADVRFDVMYLNSQVYSNEFTCESVTVATP